MHDKVVRRRRAVLALLVALSLFLLTAYFGESAGGGLHATQRGALEVLAPIQEGANKALKPARDLFGWFGDTLDAQDERDRLQRERDAAPRRGRRSCRSQNRELEQLKGLQEMNTAGGLDAVRRPCKARVYQRSPSTWYQTVTINKGSSDGVARRRPGRQRPGARRQGQVGLRRQRGRDAAHRPGLRRLRAGAAPRRAGLDHADPRRRRRPAVRPRRTTPEKIRKGDLVVTAGTVVASACRRSTRARS